MAEIVGIVAAAGQLATTCLSLIEYTRKIKGASSSLRDYQRQLHEVRSLSEAISQNPLLQTPEVGAHTSSLLALVSENDLRPLFERGRLLRSWTFLRKDRELLEVFATLERRKTSLSLTIHNLQSEAIHQIRSDVKIMANSQSSDSDSAYDSQCGPISHSRKPSDSSAGVSESGSSGTPVANDMDQVSETPLNTSRRSSRRPRVNMKDFDEDWEIHKKILKDHPHSNIYCHNFADSGGVQKNGSLDIYGSEEDSTSGEEGIQYERKHSPDEENGNQNATLDDEPVDVFVGCHSTTGSKQHNGGERRFSSRKARKAAGSGKSVYIGCEVLGSPGSEGQSTEVNQRNGRITYVGRRAKPVPMVGDWEDDVD